MIGDNKRRGHKMSLSARMQALDAATQDHFENEPFSIEKEVHAIELRAEEILAAPAEAQMNGRRTSLKLPRMPRLRAGLLVSFQLSAVAAVLVGIGAGVAWLFNHVNGTTIAWSSGATVIAVHGASRAVLHAMPKVVEAWTRHRGEMRRDKNLY